MDLEGIINDLESQLRFEQFEGYKMSACYERALNELVEAHRVINGYINSVNFDDSELVSFNITLKKKLQEEGRIALDKY